MKISSSAFSADVHIKCEVDDWRNALAVFKAVHGDELAELEAVLSNFWVRHSDLAAGGGNKSKIAKSFDETLHRLGWVEKSFDTKIVVDGEEHASPSHKVDCFKNKVALEVEWNNKDPFFDRDLNNFRLLYELRVIDLGIVVTRTTALEPTLAAAERASTTDGKATTHTENSTRRSWAVAPADVPCLCSASNQRPMSMTVHDRTLETIIDFAQSMRGQKFGTVLADPPWRFINRTGKVAPEHRRLNRYETMTTAEICELPVAEAMQPMAHLYLWTPNALLPDALKVMQAWSFTYKSNIIWHKVRKDGGSDGRGVGFYFRNVTEMLLFGTRGKNARTRDAGRRQVNYLSSRKREHSRKPDEQYDLIEQCSHGPYLEMFSRGTRKGWRYWGNQATTAYEPTWQTYSHNSKTDRPRLVVGVEPAE